jgi:hypothetical protein
MALDLIAELEKLVVAFNDAKLEYALCGGLAVAIHGHPRATMDIDFLVRSEDANAALELARTAGFDIPGRKMTFGLRTSTPHEVWRASKLEDDTGNLLSFDLLLVGSVYEQVWNTRTTISWSGHDVSIVSRAGLVTMKRLAGRPQDLADIAALEGTSDEQT